ncbi:MAG: alpha-amylase family glycosyl hydrolase [Edaphobacter sp.]
MTLNFPRYPSLYQINTRVRLREIGASIGRAATLDDLPDAELDGLAKAGFDIVWLLGVWQTGAAGLKISLSNAEWVQEYRTTLPDYRECDTCSSCFAVHEYHVNSDFGGDAALGRVRQRLASRGIRLMLDFVPNHTALDHPWVMQHPDFYVTGTAEQLASQPQNYIRIQTGSGERILAYGRDPYFSGWLDTLQLNYGNPDLQAAMLGELQRIATQCDAVRCDMAMLELPEVLERTWGMKAEAFWPKATEAARHQNPDFLFMAEVYWGLEWTLQQQGFDYTYDKRLYDRLYDRVACPVREHLMAGLGYQNKLARFLENHDEPRAAATFPEAIHKAAAMITFLTPGLRFFHQGQLQGKRVRISMHLGRGPNEPVDQEIADFYSVLLRELRDPVVRDGAWQLLNCQAAWDGNWTSDSFVAFSWTGTAQERRLIVVNYADHQSQCYVALPWTGLEERTWRFADRMGEAVYERQGGKLMSRGLYVDLPAWGYHLFEVVAA